MKILFLHGLESTPETSSTAKLITDNFDNVFVPNYNPKDSYENIKKTLSNYNDYDVVIGISLGGFWALHMTEFTDISKVIMINPAIVKAEHHYSIKLNTHSDVLGHMLLNMDDDVVDNSENLERYNNRFKVTTFETGGHRAKNSDEVLIDIRLSLNFLGIWIP